MNWVWRPDAFDLGLGAWVCSKCGCQNRNIGVDKFRDPYNWYGSKYCPNCGEKAEKEKN